MKLVISPAKSLDLESKIPTTSFTEPLFAEKSSELNGLLKKFLLADYIAVNFVDRVFDNPGMFSGFENLNS